MTTAQTQLAEQLSQVQGSDRDRARLASCLLDFTAAVLAGARTPLGRSVTDRYLRDGARGYAFTLAYLAEIPEFAHGHNRAAGHVGSTTLPATLGLAARGGTPDADWSAAALAGYEAFARAGQALMPALEQWGSHSTGFSGSLGAAASAARVHGLDASGLCSALGIAAYLTPLSALEAFSLSGGNSTAAALATTTGMLAAELVAAGERGAPDILDSLHQRIVGRPPEPAFDGDDRLAVHAVYFKPYPCCRFTHGAIQATLELLGRGVAEADLSQLVVRTTPRAVRYCGNPPQTSRSNHVERQFSIPYLVGLAVLRQRVDAEDVLAPSPELQQAVLDVAHRQVVVEADEGLVQYGNICPAVVQVRLRDGTGLEQRVLSPWGCPDTPMTVADIEAKFRQVAFPMLGPERTDAWQELALGLAWSELGQRLWHFLSGDGASAES